MDIEDAALTGDISPQHGSVYPQNLDVFPFNLEGVVAPLVRQHPPPALQTTKQMIRIRQSGR